MDELKGFFGELRDRFKNPLIFSFCVSWILLNWKVVAAVFFYAKYNMGGDEKTSFIDFVSNNLSIGWIKELLPFLIAPAYTILSPLIKKEIEVYNAKRSKEGNNRIIKAFDDAFVPMEKYKVIQKELDNNEVTFEEMKKERDGAKNNFNGSQLDNAALYKQVEDLKKSALYDLFDEKWNWKYQNVADSGDRDSEVIEIKSNNVYYSEGRGKYSLDLICKNGSEGFSFRKTSLTVDEGKEKEVRFSVLEKALNGYKGEEYELSAPKRKYKITLTKSKQKISEEAQQGVNDMGIRLQATGIVRDHVLPKGKGE